MSGARSATARLLLPVVVAAAAAAAAEAKIEQVGAESDARRSVGNEREHY